MAERKRHRKIHRRKMMKATTTFVNNDKHKNMIALNVCNYVCVCRNEGN